MKIDFLVEGEPGKDADKMALKNDGYVGTTCDQEQFMMTMTVKGTRQENNGIDKKYQILVDDVTIVPSEMYLSTVTCTEPMVAMKEYSVKDLDCKDQEGNDPFEDQKEMIGQAQELEMTFTETDVSIKQDDEDPIVLGRSSAVGCGSAPTPAPTQPPTTQPPTTQPPTTQPPTTQPPTTQPPTTQPPTTQPPTEPPTTLPPTTQPPTEPPTTQPPTPAPTTLPPTPAPTTLPPTPAPTTLPPTQPPTQPPTTLPPTPRPTHPPHPTHPPTQPPTPTPTEKPSNNMVWYIIGGVVFVVIIVICIMCCCKKSEKEKNDKTPLV